MKNIILLKMLKSTNMLNLFVGGGAVLFDILSKFDLDEIYISDINAELINTYIIVRDYIDKLIHLLISYQEDYVPLDTDNRKKYYIAKERKI